MALSNRTFFVMTWLLSTPIFIVANYLWHAMTDMWIAQSLGAFRKLPPGPYGQWTEIGAIPWTFSAVFGIGWSIYPPLAWVILLYTAFVSSLLLVNFATGAKNPMGRYKWIGLSVLAVWLLKVPVPIGYSLFYWIAIRY